METAIMAAAGAAAGALCMTASKKLSAARAENGAESKLYALKHLWLWCLVCAAGFAVISVAASETLDRLQYSAVYTLCIAIAAVDFTVRKIPNILVLALIALKVLFLILGFTGNALTDSLIGFATAAVVFTIPSFFKLSVGAGDIKLGAVTGLYLGLYSFLQAMVIMAVLMTLYGVIRLIRKTGNLKSKTAMGPYIALGLFVTALFPVL